MYCIPDSITQNEKKKNNSTERCLSFYLYRNAQIYYYASSLRNNSLFLNPHFELWNLSPTKTPTEQGNFYWERRICLF